MAETKKMEKKTKKVDVLESTEELKNKVLEIQEELSETESTGIKQTAKKRKTKTKATESENEKIEESAAKSDVNKKKKEQTEEKIEKVKVEKVPSGVVVKKNDKEIVSKIKIPKVIEEDKDVTEKKTASTKKLNTENEENKLIVNKEQTIAQKIKNFLKKIVEMQKEAKNEIEVVKEGAKVKKEAKASKAKKENDVNKDVSETYLLEYYDLPYRYNETVVRILAQTPRRLFVYWDISDEDRTKYIETFGENFFNETYPVLLLYNEDKKYIKEIVVNDFANSWYIDIDNPKTKYSVQLGRKFRNKPQIINIAKMVESNIDLQNDYLPFVNSNKVEAPNDRVLFDHFSKNVKFRNVKTGQETVKDLGVFVEKISKAYDAPTFKEIFKEMNTAETIFDEKINLDNPTSGNPTSTFK